MAPAPRPLTLRLYQAEEYLVSLGVNLDRDWSPKRVFHAMFRLGWVWNRGIDYWEFQGYPITSPTHTTRRMRP